MSRVTQRRDSTGSFPTPFVELDRSAWSRLAKNHPLEITADDLTRLRGLDHPLDLREIQEVYLPLSRLLTIPNQSSVAKAFLEFDDDGRMKPSAFYDRVVDVMEELMKFTLLTRDLAPYLVDRYSERKESAQALSRRVNQVSL